MKFNEWLAVNKNLVQDNNSVDGNMRLVNSNTFFSESTSHLTSWLNFISSDPNKVFACAWCEECQEEITNLSSGSITCRGYQEGEHEFYIECSRCLDWILGEHMPYGPTCVLAELDELSAYRQPTEVINSRCKKYGFPVDSAEGLKRKLRLLGFVNKNIGPGESCVYFIQAGSEGPVKIGFTQRSLASRIRSIQTGCPDLIRILATVPGKRETEIKLHSKFKQYRRQGEWFDPHPELMEYIHSLPVPR